MRLRKWQRAALRKMGPFTLGYSSEHADVLVDSMGVRAEIQGSPMRQIAIRDALNLVALEPEEEAVAREELLAYVRSNCGGSILTKEQTDELLLRARTLSRATRIVRRVARKKRTT